MMKWIIGLMLVAGAVCAVFAQGAKPAVKVLYECNFEKAEADKVPDDLMVLDGTWAVRSEGHNKFLELPGAPLDNFGVLFGPTQKDNLVVSARVFGTSRGRRHPVFGVGAGGVGGFKLLVAPAKRVIELFKGDEALASAPYSWDSGAWTILQLQVLRVKDGEWLVEGKAWKQGSAEPATAQVAHSETAEPPAGRAAILGSPLAGTPIRFDDLKVAVAGK